MVYKQEAGFTQRRTHFYHKELKRKEKKAGVIVKSRPKEAWEKIHEIIEVCSPKGQTKTLDSKF